MHGNSRGLTQAYRLRDIVANEALELAGAQFPNAKERLDRAKAVAALVASWEKACERIRIFKGKPLPGSKRPAPEPRKPRVKRTASNVSLGPVHPVEPQPADPVTTTDSEPASDPRRSS